MGETLTGCRDYLVPVPGHGFTRMGLPRSCGAGHNGTTTTEHRVDTTTRGAVMPNTAPDHLFTAPETGTLCTVCKLPEGNRQHTAADVVVNGTTYGGQTPRAVIDVLEGARASGQRLRLHWGDTSTGLDWGDVYGVTGRVGRSMGPVKVPILLHNARSTGGGAILDHCIVKITTSAGGHVLYQHPTYTAPLL